MIIIYENNLKKVCSIEKSNLILRLVKMIDLHLIFKKPL